MLTDELTLAEIVVEPVANSSDGQLSVESALVADLAGGLLDAEEEIIQDPGADETGDTVDDGPANNPDAGNGDEENGVELYFPIVNQ